MGPQGRAGKGKGCAAAPPVGNQSFFSTQRLPAPACLSNFAAAIRIPAGSMHECLVCGNTTEQNEGAFNSIWILVPEESVTVFPKVRLEVTLISA